MKTSKHSQEREKNSFCSGRKLPVKLGLPVKRSLLMKLLMLLLFSGFAMPQALAGVGNITNYYLDNFYFEEGAFGQPDFIQVAPNIYATVFRGNMTKGILETYQILDNGTVNRTIDTLVFYQNTTTQPEIIFVNGSTSIYAIVYGDMDSDGWVKTVNITSGGDIVGGIIDSLEFDTAQGLYPEIAFVTGKVYVIAYQGGGSDGFLKTLNISTNGSISDSTIDYLEFDGADCISDPKILHISDSVYAVAYEGTSNDGFVKTFNISATGNISNTIIDSLEFDQTTGIRPDFTFISGDIYAVAYTGNGSDGYVATINISANGSIADSVINLFEFDQLYANAVQFIQVSGATYALAYRGDGNDGFIRTLNISADGTIASNYTDSMEFDILYGIEPKIVNIAGPVFEVAYVSDLFLGYFKSMNITDTGDISNVTSSYIIRGAAARMPSMVQVSGSIFAIAYGGPDYDGFVKTVNISSNGSIQYSVLDVFEFDTAQGLYPEIYHISGDVFAVAYQGASADGFVRTFNISSNGSISDAYIASIEFDAADCMTDPKLIPVAGQVYAVAYQGSGSDGWLKTFNITSTGNISLSTIDFLEFDMSNGLRPDIVRVADDIFAITYTGNSTDGYVTTVNISSNGSIGNSIIDLMEFDVLDAYETRILNVTDSVFAVAYRGNNSDGFITTFNISPTGDISDTVTDLLEFDIADCYEPDLIHVSESVYAVAYRGTANDGFVKTFNITSTGNISSATMDSLEFDAWDGYNPVINYVAGNTYAIAYVTNVNTEGALRTVDITTIDQAPRVSLISPESNIGNNGNVTIFQYNVSDENTISSCELVLNGIVNATNNSIVKDTTLEFAAQQLIPDEYAWAINCTDSTGRENSSEIRVLTVITAYNFTGQTTDLSSVNISNITNLVLESPSYGLINFSESINLSGGANLNQYVVISNNLAAIDSAHLPQLNKPAIITLYNIYFQDPVILSDGAVCEDCSLISNDGNISFSVTHFSNYSASGNSKLVIWDSTDADRKEPDEPVSFFANYTNTTSGEFINGTGTWCAISFEDTNSTPMGFNTTTLMYGYQRTFATEGIKYYNITCNGSAHGFEVLNLTDTAGISPDVYGAKNNSRQFSTRTKVNITNGQPEILNIACNNGNDITLAVGSTQNVLCTIKIRDFNGGSTITSANATFYNYLNTSTDPDDNNVHYTNTSCTQNSTDGYNATWVCAFDVWYYANNGTWQINATVQDDYPYTVSNVSNTTIIPLYALNVTSVIDFGNLAASDTSSITGANVTNLGNMRINISVYAFGGDNEATGAGLAMVCEQRNITLSNERYSLDPAALYDTMTPVTAASTLIPDLVLPQQINDAQQEMNNTYWRLHVNVTTNPFGMCNGTIVFSAEAP